MARIPRGSHTVMPASERVDAGRVDDKRIRADSARPIPPKREPPDRRATRKPVDGTSAESSVELDAAIETVLAAGGVDAVTRVRLGEMRRAIAQGSRIGDPPGFEGRNLSHAMYRFVMPRLHHPEVLRADRHHALLEGLAERLAGAGEDGVVREGALVIHRELRRMAQLRAARNALIEG